MAGIGAFGRAMIPLGSAAGTLSNFNQQALKNHLDQQRMQMDQQKLDLEMRNQKMMEAQQQFTMGQSLYTLQQDKASRQALSTQYASQGLQSHDPQKRMGWDALANMVLNNAPPDAMKMVADEYGIGDEFKKFKEWADAQGKLGSAAASGGVANVISPGSYTSPGTYPGPGGGAPPGSPMLGPGGGGGGGGAPSGFGGALPPGALGWTKRPDGATMGPDGRRYVVSGGAVYPVGGGP
jgi:hypothetical protein